MGKKPKSAAYVVRRGRKPGIYFSWAECEEQVHRFPGAACQGYRTEQQAQSAWDTWKEAEGFIRNGSHAEPRIPLINLANLQTTRTIEPSALPAQARSLKRSSSFIDLTGSNDDEPATKRAHYFVDLKGATVDNERQRATNIKLEGDRAQSAGDSLKVELEDELEVQEESIPLTPAQMAVVKLAMDGHNIFLTGAAGSGKTATLKEILRRLKAQFKGPRGAINDESKFDSVQVVAPTGIAALPLNGKTTYSFAGWKPDSFQKPITMLLGEVPKRVRIAMQKLQVVIIEEISMVENQFLERLNKLMQYVLQSNEPFGGKQTIFLGDFHQLPPVKPFEFCLSCGEVMINQNIRPVCDATDCLRRGKSFELGEKWAFHAPVWKGLRLKHVKLERIHRQKDTRFQDVLNKIRNGVYLTDEEWAALTAKKDGTFAVKLMSRRKDVTVCNTRHLKSIKLKPESWDSLDSCRKLHRTEDDAYRTAEIAKRIAEHRETLKDHRFPTTLTLKIGAKVVLLSNINPAGGLVNGSQGEVVKFVDTTEWQVKEPEGKGKGWLAEQAKIQEFQAARGYICPVVRFLNGKTVTIQPIAQDSLRGPSYDKYLVSRTQVPLALAWALSIHKSQGMTLGHVEVSSNAIFESGQLYVGLSRATRLEGLTVTGYSREQLEMDEDVLEFYETAPWEDLGASNVPRPHEQAVKNAL